MPRQHNKTVPAPEGRFLISGAAKGPITHADEVVVAVDGKVSGSISAKRIVVDGEVDGDLHATECIHIGATGKVHGDLKAPRIGVQTGAKLRGRIRMHGGAHAKDLGDTAVHKLLLGEIR